MSEFNSAGWPRHGVFIAMAVPPGGTRCRYNKLLTDRSNTTLFLIIPNLSGSFLHDPEISGTN